MRPITQETEASSARKDKEGSNSAHDETTASRTQHVFRRYARGADRPLAGYATLIGAYLASVGVGVGLLRARGVRLPRRVPANDLALLSMACFRATRLVSKDSITSVIRSPFTVYEGAAGEGEINEEVIGTGLRHAVGELVTCPFCLTVWASTLAMFGLLSGTQGNPMDSVDPRRCNRERFPSTCLRRRSEFHRQLTSRRPVADRTQPTFRVRRPLPLLLRYRYRFGTTQWRPNCQSKVSGSNGLSPPAG